MKREVESDDYAKFLHRAIRAMGRRASEDVDALILLRDLADHVEQALDDAAVALHNKHYPYSWGEIAQRLGVSRQAVQKRWGGPSDNVEKGGASWEASCTSSSTSKMSATNSSGS